MYQILRIMARKTISEVAIHGRTVNRSIYTSILQNFPNITQRHADEVPGNGGGTTKVSIEQDLDNTWKLRRKVVCSSPNIFNKTPQQLCFDVAYIDSGADWDLTKKKSSPTILAVHGCPATHTDVLPVIKSFHNKGCRVMAINMPGYEHTSGVSKEDHDKFMHSTSELLEFLHHFLETMDIRYVDMLVGHSGGTLPCTALTGLSDHVRAIMHICPPPGHTLPHSARPHSLIKFMCKLYGTSLGKIILRPLIPKINRTLVGLNSDRPSHLMSAIRYVSNIDFTLLQTVAMEIDLEKIPSVFVYSKNDSLVEPHLSKEWAKKLGIEQENFDEYDRDFNLTKCAADQEASDYRKGVLFARGGHFPQFKTETALPILIKEAEKLLAMSLAKSKTSI